MKTADEIANENRQAEEFLADQRKSSASSHTTFAERVAELERVMQLDIQTVNGTMLPDLLACIREQQAALDYVANMDYAHSAINACAFTAHEKARAVLARWRIE